MELANTSTGTSHLVFDTILCFYFYSSPLSFPIFSPFERALNKTAPILAHKIHLKLILIILSVKTKATSAAHGANINVAAARPWRACAPICVAHVVRNNYVPNSHDSYSWSRKTCIFIYIFTNKNELFISISK